MVHLCWHCGEETTDVCMCCRLPVCYRCGTGPRFRRSLPRGRRPPRYSKRRCAHRRPLRGCSGATSGVGTAPPLLRRRNSGGGGCILPASSHGSMDRSGF